MAHTRGCRPKVGPQGSELGVGAWVALLYSIGSCPRSARGDVGPAGDGRGPRPRSAPHAGRHRQPDLRGGRDRGAGAGGAAGAGLRRALRAEDRHHRARRGRTGAGWSREIPFPGASAVRPAKVAVRVQRAPLDPAFAATLEPYRADGEHLAVVGGDLWLDLPHGVAGSRLASARHAGAGGGRHFRNWNTVAADRRDARRLLVRIRGGR